VYPQAHEASLKMLYQLFTMEWSQQLLNTIIERIEYSYRSSSEEPMSMLMGQAASLWRRGKFQSMYDRLDELKMVTLDKIHEVRKKILTNLNGVYGVIGTDDSFKPNFPDDTWTGSFE